MERRVNGARRGPEGKVLLVDLDTGPLLFARAVLDRAGVRADAFSCPERALEAFRSSPTSYRGAIIDRSTRIDDGADGLDTCGGLAAALRATSPEIHILILFGDNCSGCSCRHVRLESSLLAKKPLTLDTALVFLNDGGAQATDVTHPSIASFAKIFA